MNKLECEIVRIVRPPHQVIDEENCCWETEVEYICYGYINRRIIKGVAKSQLNQYVVGYTWME